jgi:hypothetical protein
MKKLRYSSENIKALCVELNRKRESFKTHQWERKDLEKLMKDIGLPHDPAFITEMVKQGIFVKKGSGKEFVYQFCKDPIHHTVLENVFYVRRTKIKEIQNEKKRKSEIKEKKQHLDSAFKNVVNESLLCSVLQEQGIIVEGESFYDENTLVRIAKVCGYKVCKINKVYL